MLFIAPNEWSRRTYSHLRKHYGIYWVGKVPKDNGVIKYSAYLCPNCLNQSELFGKQAYRELNVVECARDGINSQTQLCIDKNIKGFPTWEINGKLILGVLSLKELSKLTGFKN